MNELLAIVTASTPYAMILEGNDLAPRFYHGDRIVIDPLQKDAQPGNVVLALCPAKPPKDVNLAHLGPAVEVVAPSVLLVSNDGHLTAGRVRIPAERCTVLGTVTGRC